MSHGLRDTNLNTMQMMQDISILSIVTVVNITCKVLSHNKCAEKEFIFLIFQSYKSYNIEFTMNDTKI